MGWDLTDDGFIIPEGLGMLNHGPEDQEYKVARQMFDATIIGGNVSGPYTTEDSPKYGSSEFSDSQLVQFYFNETPKENIAKAVLPFFKKVYLPKISKSVTEYIKANYDPNDDGDGTTKEQEEALKKGLERYLAKLTSDNRDQARAISKIGDLGLSEFHALLHQPDGSIPHERVINLFFAEQFVGPDGGDTGTISDAEALQVEELAKLNLTSGAGDAEHDKSWYMELLDGAIDLGKDALNTILPDFLIPDFARKTTTIGMDDLTKEEISEVRQCILSSDLLNPGTNADWCQKYMNVWHTARPNPDPSAGTGSYFRTGEPFDSRIIPITTSKSFDPNTLINLCTVSKDTKRYLLDDDALAPEMFYKFYWVYNDGKGLKETEIFMSTAPDDYQWEDGGDFMPGSKRAKQIRDAMRNGYGYAMSQINLELKGNQPATARNSLKMDLTIELDNLKSMSAVCAYVGESEVKISDLYTFPHTQTLETKKTFNGGVYKQEYHPDYSRIRVKIWCYEGGMDPNNVKTAMIFDICSHKNAINRKDDGTATVTISYTGYYNSMMNMADQDALAPPSVISARAARRKENSKVISEAGCDEATASKILKAQQEFDRIEALHNIKTGTIVRELFKKGLMFGYYFDEEYVDGKVIDGTLPPTENYLKAAEWLGNIEIKPPDGGGIINWMADAANSFAGLFNADEPTMDGEGNVDAGNKGKGYPHYGFFLGDLMYVLTECLYKEGSAEMHDWVDNMNMRFMVTSIPVPDPNNKNNLRLISPLAVPIDLKLFTTWFHETVIKPGKSVYPVGLMIKELIERLINGVLWDTCFGLAQSGNKPAQLKVSYFTDHRSKWHSCSGSPKFFNPGDNMIMQNRPTSTVSEAKTYCVIHIENPAYLQQIRAAKASSFADDPYTLPFYYGTNRKSVNYVTDVQFSRRTIPNVKESRIMNASQGNFDSINMLMDAYDLNFKLKSPKALTAMYPGMIINFILTDWAPAIEWEQGDFLGESDPHKNGTLSNKIGIGGYFTIKSVNYIIKLNVWNDFSVDVTTMYTGNDGGTILRSQGASEKSVSKPPAACTKRYNTIVEDIRAISAASGIEANIGSKDYSEGDSGTEGSKEERVKEPPEKKEET